LEGMLGGLLEVDGNEKEMLEVLVRVLEE
jgi:hypothetical protein